MSEQEKDKIKQNHVVTIDNRKKMMLTGLVEVVSATDKTVLAKTGDKQVSVLGGDLRVVKLSLEEGILILEGTIDSLKYGELKSGKSLIKRIFK